MNNTSIKTLQQWGTDLEGMLLCAGPCSAESPAQLLGTAAGLAGQPLTFFRAGVWKPRTHPGTFEGAGVEALPWLVEVRQQFGFPVGTEVGTAQHAEAALRFGLDVVWIGARTTPDPYAVQEIAEALKGVDIPVLVKNPVSPDLELWLGALERVQNAGIRRLAAVHRGFCTASDTRYRNPPLWRLAIELKRRVPEVSLLCDPSHMCGRTETIFPTSQEALDLLYNGLIVEVHENPPQARSDAAQQLTPAQFHDMIRRLVIPCQTDDPYYQAQMRGLRHAIDEIDEDIVSLLARRMEVVRQMVAPKRRHRVSALQPSRWLEILASRTSLARQKGLNDEFVAELYKLVHEEAIRVQEESLLAGEAPDAGAGET
jgi:chorismate mutase